MATSVRYGIAAIVIAAAVVLLFWGLLFPRDPEVIYPWSSDAWGHLIKAEYLREQIDLGNYYPDMFPAWYSGQQMLRYYAPLPYYILVGIRDLTGSIWTAGNLFMALCALFGSLSFLLFARRIGLFWAVVGGVLFLMLPDNLRVMFAEGNMPRVLATGLLPLAFFLLLNLVERGGRGRDFVSVGVVMGLIVLSHAMMAAIFLLGLGLYVIVYWLTVRGHPRLIALGAVALGSGLFVSAWWLLPSLTGGITELNQAAASEAVATFPMSVVLNPGLRAGDKEIFYVGLALITLPMLAFPLWGRLEPWSRALVIVALFMGLISTTLVNDIWKALPFNSLFWPLRFMSFAGFALLVAAIDVARTVFSMGSTRERRLLRFAALAIPLLLFADFWPSASLAHARERPEDITRAAQDLRELDGWRVATADLSRLGSAPSMLFTTEGGREQVFGWAFQGSITAPLIARINQAMGQEHIVYAVSRFERLGADDIVYLPTSEISIEFGQGLLDAGYEVTATHGRVRIYHRDGRPRAVRVPMRVLGIGDGANNLALLFPEVSVGSSTNINDYDPEFLDQFEVLVLSRFTYDQRKAAEDVIVDFVSGGKRVILDLTGAPLDALSRQPKFLGIYGEALLEIGQARTIIEGVLSPLLPFTDEYGPWRGVTPQGTQEVIVPFEYPAARGVAIGRNTYGEGSVDFLGLNLIFHAAITSDPLAIRLLEPLVGAEAGARPEDETVPLVDYQAGEDGYHFEVTTPRDEWLLFPMAYHSGTSVTVDGTVVQTVGMETLTLAHIPAGTHRVHIRSDETGVYLVGRAATVVGVLVLIGYVLARVVRRPSFLRWPGRSAGHRPPDSRGVTTS